MKRKPYAYIGDYDEGDDHLYALNCNNKEQALIIMRNEYVNGNEEMAYQEPDFSVSNIEEIHNFFCRKCHIFNPDNICTDCERNLQGRIHTIYALPIELK